MILQNDTHAVKIGALCIRYHYVLKDRMDRKKKWAPKQKIVILLLRPIQCLPSQSTLTFQATTIFLASTKETRMLGLNTVPLILLQM